MQFSNPIVNRLVIYGSDGLPDVVIGPGPRIVFYNVSDPFLIMGTFPPDPYPRIKFIDTPTSASFDLRLSPITGNASISASNPSEGNSFSLGENVGGTVTLSASASSSFCDFIWRPNPVVGAGNDVVVYGGRLIASDPFVAGARETWHAVTFQNGWSTFSGSGFPPSVAYRQMPDGTVLLRGIAQAGTKTNGTTVFILPSAYRPPYKQQFVGNTDVAAVTFRLQVFATGEIQIFDIAATAAALISFDGVRFPLPELT